MLFGPAKWIDIICINLGNYVIFVGKSAIRIQFQATETRQKESERSRKKIFKQNKKTYHGFSNCLLWWLSCLHDFAIYFFYLVWAHQLFSISRLLCALGLAVDLKLCAANQNFNLYFSILLELSSSFSIWIRDFFLARLSVFPSF